MSADLMNFDLPPNKSSIIKVIGVGGGGGNAVNHMFRQGITDVDFIICNTDAQALDKSEIPVKIQLGENLTHGRGAGNKPEQGKQAAIESIDKITEILSHNTQMVFITAGMGGGTGTGAAPVIAEEAKELGILTVGIITLPFRFEGRRRTNQAIDGLNEMRKYVDALLVINNEKLREIHGDLPLSQAFGKADDVLAIAAKGIAEIITVHGFVNVDFADVYTVMSNSGVALMGSATASGDNRAVDAIEEALNSPLLNNNDIRGAKNILLNIASAPSHEVKMDEIEQITDYIQEAAGMNADIIWGNTLDDSLDEKLNITIIATGFKNDSVPELDDNKDNDVVKKVKLIDDNESDNKNYNEQKESTDDIPFVVIDKTDNQENTTLSDNTNNEEDDNLERFELFSQSAENDEKKEEATQLNLEIIPDTVPENINIKKIKKPEVSYNNSNDIDELENVPAFKRKNIKLEEMEEIENQEKEISRFSLSDDENGNIKINNENSFLHDNVD
jgi:cell division protein FtsZ